MSASSDFGRGVAGRVVAFLRDEDGATAIEYGLIAAMIAVAIIVGVTALGGNVNAMHDRNSDCFNQALATRTAC
ncbi:Flp family type IVb pilin [Zavarzinia sp. CC-PAN008]|uniref:Flp family type IVb pilin n=1 Tax=Zavarzinia sp. CC-PAN008 TaxID=3243332 RepID=UPI003F7487DC